MTRKIGQMKKLHFEIVIDAPAKQVWDSIVHDKPFREWCAAFAPGSYFEGSWEKGAKIRFLAKNEDGGIDGMTSEIAESRPYEFISIRHLGILKNGAEDTESEFAKDWKMPSYENYRLRKEDGKTRLTVDVEAPESFVAMFNEMWPKALEKLKETSEGIQKITPHLWFDKEAKEAAKFYTSIFRESKIKNTTTLHNTPSGSVDIVTVELSGQEFTLISAGPLFKFTPAVSCLVACNTEEEVDALWGELLEGGMALMELGKYPFSEKYGWVQDRYGLSWQVMFMGDRKIKQKITPTLMFVGKQCGKAEEAINFYASVFHNAEIGDILRYGKHEEPDKEGTVKHAAFTLEGQDFAAMDSAREHNFTFNEAVSFMVHCNTQEEIDDYWGKLSADPEAEQCGWLKDKYGLSWQIVPTVMHKMLMDKNKKKMARVTEAFLKMKKFDIETLNRAYEGNK